MYKFISCLSMVTEQPSQNTSDMFLFSTTSGYHLSLLNINSGFVVVPSSLIFCTHCSKTFVPCMVFSNNGIL